MVTICITLVGDPVRRLAVFRITGTVAWLAYGAATRP